MKGLTTTPQPPQPRARARTRAWRSQHASAHRNASMALSAELVHLHRFHRSEQLETAPIHLGREAMRLQLTKLKFQLLQRRPAGAVSLGRRRTWLEEAIRGN